MIALPCVECGRAVLFEVVCFECEGAGCSDCDGTGAHDVSLDDVLCAACDRADRMDATADWTDI